MTAGFFVTGTDTEVGKTVITTGLMSAFASAARSVVGMKPVASGCARDEAGRLRNADALAIRAACTHPVAYETLNPYAFAPAIAPHLAAAEAGVTLRFDVIADHWRALLGIGSDAAFMEGAGGWRVPLGRDFDMADLPRRLGLPVVLVVGVRLGCINHALLTAGAIVGDGCQLAGWVANECEPAGSRVREQIDTLAGRMPAPLLGHVPYQRQPEPSDVAACLKWTDLEDPVPSFPA